MSQINRSLLNDFDPTLENDPRYPGWHQWLSVAKQNVLAKILYVVFCAWTVLYFLCKFQSSIDPHGTLFEFTMSLPLLNYILAAVLLLGMVSKLGISQKLAFIVVPMFFAIIWMWPRLAVPGLSGLLSMFLVYILIYVVWSEDAVDWSNFGVPGYMVMVGPSIGIYNMFLFKQWCAGHLPKFFYWIHMMVFMVCVTIKEYMDGVAAKDTAGFDYKVTIPVYKRLIPFRIAVLPLAQGVAVTWIQEQLLELLKEDVWACTPLSW